MIARSLVVLIPMLGAAVHSAIAQDSASVDPTVSEVTTGGRWTFEGRSGFYRIIIRTGGSTSNLTIEWLTDPSRGDPPGIVRSMPVPELSGLARLDRGRIGQYIKGWRLWIQATDPRAPEKPTSRSVDLGQPGEFKVARSP